MATKTCPACGDYRAFTIAHPDQGNGALPSYVSFCYRCFIEKLDALGVPRMEARPASDRIVYTVKTTVGLP